MKAYHNSSNTWFRAPVGAVLENSPCFLQIVVSYSNDDLIPLSCTLHIKHDNELEQCISMSVFEFQHDEINTVFNKNNNNSVTSDKDHINVYTPWNNAYLWTDSMEVFFEDKDNNYLTYSASFIPQKSGVYWYKFCITLSDNSCVWYGPQEGFTAGECSSYPTCAPYYQISVFKQHAVPFWYKKGIAYQIFPDRFARESNWHVPNQEKMSMPRKGPQRVFVEDWDSPVSYLRDKDGSILQWDFYGGTLKGIIEKLDYLQNLGISILYLNPLFKATSNHRYDVADYFEIDPLLGSKEDFKELCCQAELRGMSVMLDGVFNHSGKDSLYFNAYGNYPTCGAYQSKESPYRDWYKFHDDGSYDCWNGIPDLPEFQDNNKELQHLMYGQNGVVGQWLKLGARAWRLDAADQMSDFFLAGIKDSAQQQLADSVVIGEVWDDASHINNKGIYKQFLLGCELDGQTNYPFRGTLIEFLLGDIGAHIAAERFQELFENHPHEIILSNLTILGSHDCDRILTILGGAPGAQSMTEEECGQYRLPKDRFELACNRIRLATLMQIAYPGVPCVYYGDEVGMQAYSDPFNRATMPWHSIDAQIFSFYREVLSFHVAMSLYSFTQCAPFNVGDEILGFWRFEKPESELFYEREISEKETFINEKFSFQKNTNENLSTGNIQKDMPENELFSSAVSQYCSFSSNRSRKRNNSSGEALCVSINRSPWDTVNFQVEAAGQEVSELFHDNPAIIEDGCVKVSLKPFERSVLYFHNKRRLQKDLQKGLGYFAPFDCENASFYEPHNFSDNSRGLAKTRSLNSIDSPHTIGSSAKCFLKQLSKHGYDYWYIGSTNPTMSSFSNTSKPDHVPEDNCSHGCSIAQNMDSNPKTAFSNTKMDFKANTLLLESNLLSAFAGTEELLELPSDEQTYLDNLSQQPSYKEFCECNYFWLKPYAVFCAINKILGCKGFPNDSNDREDTKDSINTKGSIDSHVCSAYAPPCAFSWQEWPEQYSRYYPELEDQPELKEEIELIYKKQFAFYVQMNELLSYAHGLGISIVSSLPHFVNAQSVDVWSRPELFHLDKNRYPRFVNGVPSSMEMSDGYNSECPTYNWNTTKQRCLDWWLQRLRCALSRTDYIVLEDFENFESCFNIPVCGKASDGFLSYGPGYDLFVNCFNEVLDQKQPTNALPFLYQLCSDPSPATRALIARTGFNNINTIQWDS